MNANLGKERDTILKYCALSVSVCEREKEKESEIVHLGSIAGHIITWA